MPKNGPPDLPALGDRCRLRGREPIGTVRQINSNKWTQIDWDEGVTGPKVCHLNELEKV